MNNEKLLDYVRYVLHCNVPSQLEGFKHFLNAFSEYDIEIHQASYILATVWHETGQAMQPILETKALTVDHAIQILDRSFRSGRLTWVKNPYWRKDTEGKSWLGRGYVQITHKDNYRRIGCKIGADLISNPELALNQEIATRIAIDGMLGGWFTGKSLNDYINSEKKDYINARRVINGTDKADLIADYAKQFLYALT